MFALLLGAAVIYLVLGDLREAVVLAVFASTSVLIAVVQETRTERVLETLRDLTSPRALMIRDGEEISSACPPHRAPDQCRRDNQPISGGPDLPMGAAVRCGS
jgi:hypothetical protein